MHSQDLFQRYLAKYHIKLQHPEHGMVLLTSPVWPQHPELQRAIQTTIQDLTGVASVTACSPEQLIVRYDSNQLRRINPLSLIGVERRLNQQYHQAGY